MEPIFDEEDPALYDVATTAEGPAGALPLTPEAVPAATENIRLAGYEHMGWGAGRIGADIYMDHLIANGKQNAAVTVGILDTGLDMEHPYFAGVWCCLTLPGYHHHCTLPTAIPSRGTGLPRVRFSSSFSS